MSFYVFGLFKIQIRLAYHKQSFLNIYIFIFLTAYREKKILYVTFTWEICQISPLLTRRCLSLSFPVQFLSAWVLVCSELQIGPRSFIQNQMRVWQPLHLRHFSAHQLRLGKSSVSWARMRACLLFFLSTIHLKCFVQRVSVNAVQCERIVLVVFERFLL